MCSGVPTILPDIIASGLQNPRSVSRPRFSTSSYDIHTDSTLTNEFGMRMVRIRQQTLLNVEAHISNNNDDNNNKVSP